MDSQTIISSLPLFFFIVLSGFFSSAETAFTSINPVRARSLGEKNGAAGKRVEKLLRDPRRLLTCILIGNNIANVAASTLATATALQVLKGIGFTNYATSLAIITGIMTILILVFGEITPKSMVLKNPDKWTMLYSRPISVLMFIFYPIVSVFQFLTLIVSKLLGLSNEDVGKFLTTDELKTMVTMSGEEGILEKEEQEMIHSIISFSDTVVREIMTPRTDVVCIDVNSSIREIIQLISEKGHSRIPVYEEKIDNILGIVYAKDLLLVGEDNLDNSLRKFFREAEFIPESKSIEELFRQMKLAKFHMAIVLDEHGGFSGITTMEDIIEEITGEILDEYDTEAFPEFEALSDTEFIVDAKMSTYDFAEKIDVELPETDDYDTVGGFILSLFGRFPTRGDSIIYQDVDKDGQHDEKQLLLLVKEIKKRRIIRVHVTKTVVDSDDD